MRILWLNVGGLWPLNTGGRQRSFHIISELARRHRLTVLTTDGAGDDHAALAAELPGCEVISVPYALPKRGSAAFALALLRSWFSALPVTLWKWRIPALQREAARRLVSERADLCVVDFLYAVPNLPPGVSVPVVLFEHNAEYLIWKRLYEAERSRFRRALLDIEWKKLRRAEAAACARAALTLAVSENDRAALAQAAPEARVRAIPTGVDTSYFHPNGTRQASAKLVFSGSMDWYPNEEAMLYFIDAILPLIRREIPQASLTVVGRNPGPQLRAAANASVQVTGTVEDVRPYIGAATVYVVPLRIGGGTRIKIFEALAMGKAVVSTRIGAEGLPLIPGEHYLAADDPEHFARAVVELIRCPERRRALEQAGRKLMEERHSWKRAAREFELHCEEVINHAR